MRYWSGYATADECAVLEQWATSSPERQRELDRLRAAWDGVADLRPPSGSPAAWARVSARLHHASAGPQSVLPLPRGGESHASVLPRTWPRGVAGGSAWRSAVVAALVVVVGAGIAVGAARRGGRSVNVARREYATAAGQRLSVTLIDGTRVTLAPASRVRLAAAYGEGGPTGGSKTRPYGAREVELEGEAYFVVAHDAAHPFAVRARGVVARDVGTAFDVRAYADDRAVRVAVAEGRVALAAEAQSRSTANLGAGDLAFLDPSGAVSVTRDRDVAELLVWRQGGLAFDNTPFADVVKDLARTFNLDIAVADSTLFTNRITSSFGDESPDEVLEAVSLAVGGRYTRAGRRVVIRRQASAADQRPVTVPAPGIVTARSGTTGL